MSVADSPYLHRTGAPGQFEEVSSVLEEETKIVAYPAPILDLLDCGINRLLVDPLSAKGFNGLSEAEERGEHTVGRGARKGLVHQISQFEKR